MPGRIVVVDYSAERRNHLKVGLRARFSDVEVFELPTQAPDPKKSTDYARLAELKANSYDLLIGHMGGNPSGYECLKTFKDSNPKGKAILYTKLEAIPLDQFEGLKLANAIFRRAEDSNKVFANDDQMFDVVSRVRKEAGLVHWTSPFRDKAVLATILPLATGTLHWA